MQKVVLGLGLVLLCLAPNLRAADIAIQGGLCVTADPGQDTLLLMEFPFTLYRDQFEFYRADSTDEALSAQIFAQVTLINSSGHAVDSATTYFTVRCKDAREAARHDVKLFNQLSLPVAPGLYSAHLTVIDVVDKDQGSVFHDEILVEPARRSGPVVTGERLAYRIRPVPEGGGVVNPRMVKNGLEVLTNPVGLLDVADSVIYVYAETYNLDTSGADNRYTISYRVLDDNDEVIEDFGSAVRQKPGPSVVLAQRLEKGSWPEGMCRLEIVVGDLATGLEDTASLAFRVVSPESVSILAANISSRARQESAYYDLSLKDQVQLLTYRLTPEQKRTLDGLTDEGKKNFLEAYWQQNDENPNTVVNETREHLVELYNYVNEHFSFNSVRSNGWLTDRGRVVMKYGFADEIDRQDAPIIGDGFQIWYYTTLKEGLIFVFEVKEGYSDYELVHSTADGERYSEAWEQRLRSAGFRELMQDM